MHVVLGKWYHLKRQWIRRNELEYANLIAVVYEGDGVININNDGAKVPVACGVSSKKMPGNKTSVIAGSLWLHWTALSSYIYDQQPH